jgi:hypothetical protein
MSAVNRARLPSPDEITAHRSEDLSTWAPTATMRPTALVQRAATQGFTVNAVPGRAGVQSSEVSSGCFPVSNLSARLPRQATPGTASPRLPCPVSCGDVVRAWCGRAACGDRTRFTRQKSVVRTQPRPSDGRAGQRLGVHASSDSVNGQSGMGPPGATSVVGGAPPAHPEPRRRRGAGAV